MSAQMKEARDRMIFRHTNDRKGRHIPITPENSLMKQLVYGRIILDRETPNVAFSTGALETGLICMYGDCTITADGQANRIDRDESIYQPRETEDVLAKLSAINTVE